MIDFSIIPYALPFLLRGTLMSLAIALSAACIGLCIAIGLVIAQHSKSKIAHGLVQLYLTLMRGTPMLIQIPFFCYYIFPLMGLHLSLAVGATLAIGLNSGAYLSQIIRSGISSIGKGQYEAAHALGFTQFQTLRYIILPQALSTIVPSLINEFITLIKDSSLVSTVGVVELFKEGTIIISRTYNAIPIYCAIASIYIILTLALSCLGNLIERKIKPHAHH